jgi:hypothetical protein
MLLFCSSSSYVPYASVVNALICQYDARFIRRLFCIYKERSLISANTSFFQLYHSENKLIFNEMMMKSASRIAVLLLC